MANITVGCVKQFNKLCDWNRHIASS